MNYCVTFSNTATVRDIVAAREILADLGWTVHSVYTGIGCIIVHGSDTLIAETKKVKGVNGVEHSL